MYERPNLEQFLIDASALVDEICIFTAGFGDYAASVISTACIHKHVWSVYSNSHTTTVEGKVGPCHEGRFKVIDRLLLRDGTPLMETDYFMVDDNHLAPYNMKIGENLYVISNFGVRGDDNDLAMALLAIKNWCDRL